MITFKKIIYLSLLGCVFNSSIFAADIPALKNLFRKSYNQTYQPRFCGRNIEAFIAEALKLGINLENSYVLKIVGGGFLETSAFYTRENTNKRVMLGYFHMVLVADGVVFDFDLANKKILKLKSYIRLQFTPPYEPFSVYGIDFTRKGNPSNWLLTGFDTKKYGYGLESRVFEKKLKQHIDIEKMKLINRSNL